MSQLDVEVSASIMSEKWSNALDRRCIYTRSDGCEFYSQYDCAAVPSEKTLYNHYLCLTNFNKKRIWFIE